MSINTIPLFPLHAVLFPGGLMNLTVFEARCVELIDVCRREQKFFGSVMLSASEGSAFESIGCEAEVLDIHQAGAGVLRVACRGHRRFEVKSSHEAKEGGWPLALIDWLPADPQVLPSQAFVPVVKALANAMARLKAEKKAAFLEPFDFKSVGWIANRWCELLPIPLSAKQRLMALPDPQARLQLVDQFLRTQGVL
jgi:Lon protease-like protein